MTSRAVVLIVEDDSQLAELYATWLEDDHEVRVATLGHEALELFDADVDIVLLDRGLTDIPGDEVLGRLRATGVACQIAIISGVEPDFDLLKLDIDGYLTKPVDRAAVNSLVDDLINRDTMEQSLDHYFQLAAKKRALEEKISESELASNPEYRRLVSELRGRRSQFNTELQRIEDPELYTREVIREQPMAPPRYETNRVEFLVMWTAAFLTYGLGDTLSTLYAVTQVPELAEANPLVDGLLESFGLAGFFILKILIFLVLVTISIYGARNHDLFSYYWPPAVTFILGFMLTAWNLWLILLVS